MPTCCTRVAPVRVKQLRFAGGAVVHMVYVAYPGLGELPLVRGPHVELGVAVWLFAGYREPQASLARGVHHFGAYLVLGGTNCGAQHRN